MTHADGSPIANDTVDRDLRRFMVLTFAFSWLIWAVAVAISQMTDIDQPALLVIIILIGAFGPSASAYWLTRKDHGKKAARRFLRRGLQLKTIPAWVWLAMIAVPAAAWAGSMWLVSRDHDVSFDTELLPFYPLLLIVMILGGPLQEEYGWRGYALDRMQIKWNALTSSVVLALIWSTWHIPLFFINDTAQQDINLGMFYVSELGISILMTWLYNSSRASIALALIFHAVVNSIGDLFILGGDIGGAGYNYYALVQLALAAVVVLIFGAAKLSRSAPPERPLDLVTGGLAREMVS